METFIGLLPEFYRWYEKQNGEDIPTYERITLEEFCEYLDTNTDCVAKLRDE